jgi:hypothetical protein
MTFKKKTPDLINLFFHSPIDDCDVLHAAAESGETKSYSRIFRVSKRELFIKTLQVRTVVILVSTILSRYIDLLLMLLSRRI